MDLMVHVTTILLLVFMNYITVSVQSRLSHAPKNLTCYSCYRGIKDNISVKDNCLSAQNVSSLSQTQCPDKERFCMARIFKVKKPEGIIDVRWFLRGCTSACDPGCISVGDIMKLTICITCCQDNLCNDYRSTSTSHKSVALLILTLMIHRFL